MSNKSYSFFNFAVKFKCIFGRKVHSEAINTQNIATYQKLIYLSLMITLHLSCTKDAEIGIKNYPVIQTLEVSKIDANGAMFNGQFINIGLSEIIEYGFIFATDEAFQHESDTILVSKKASNGIFSANLNTFLIANLNYRVRAFAKTKDNIIYGNFVQFQSQGSSENPWSLKENSRWEEYVSYYFYGTSNGKFGIIIDGDGNISYFDPTTNILSNIEGSIYNTNPQSSRFNSFCLNEYVYFIDCGLRELWRLKTRKEYYATKIGDVPSEPYNQNGSAAFAINNIGYYLTTDGFYAYDESSNSWAKKASIPATFFHSVQVLGNEVYVFSKNIWKYNPESNLWTKETEFPGIWYKNIISFSIKNKLYYGLSSDNCNSATDLWEYTPELKTWKEIENSPLNLPKQVFINFSFDSVGYLGFFTMDLYKTYHIFSLFEFNPKKIK